MSIESVGCSSQNIDPFSVSGRAHTCNESAVSVIAAYAVFTHHMFRHTQIAHDTTLCNYTCIGKHILGTLLSVRHSVCITYNTAICVQAKLHIASADVWEYESSCTVAITHICVECPRVSVHTVGSTAVCDKMLSIQLAWGYGGSVVGSQRGFPRKLCLTANLPPFPYTHIVKPSVPAIHLTSCGGMWHIDIAL